ncbi:Peptidase M50 [Cynara cardunculus var. scolymus]|uniref:Peptidase M50 n=1 Tax=Cynara cardunculus var. scolymus TaxID=59895 RepID=A0A103Y9B5_CYNCS|nr:Peptidase M50 [Cynara cardunculus var. scolymus]
MSFSATMTTSASFRGNFIPLSHCSSCSDLRFQPFISSSINHGRRRNSYPLKCVSGLVVRGNRVIKCRASETETGGGDDNDKEREVHEDVEIAESTNPSGPVIDKGKDKGQLSQLEALNKFLDGTKAEGLSEDKGQPTQLEMLNKLLNKDGADAKAKEGIEDKSQLGQLETLNKLLNSDDAESKGKGLSEDADNIPVTSGSPLPGVKPQQLDDLIMIPKETVDILKDQVFGFDTFFVTSQEPYEGGVLFKGNLRGQAAVCYRKIEKRLQETFGDQYKLFLLINPEDDKPVAVVVPRKTLQPETTAVPEWFAAGSFGLVSIFTLLLRNVPALQSNLLSIFDTPDLLKDGLSGALVTALALGVHEISHILVARSAGVKLGVPFFVPSWQDLLKIAAAGPLAGFSLGLVLLLLGFYLPPADGIGVIVDASVFHESLLAGGIAKLLLGDVLKEGATISINPLVIWAWAGLLINAINSIPAGELDGGRISFAIWGRKAASRFTAASIVLLGLSSLLDDVAFYWVVLIFFLQRGPIAPLAEEISEPDDKYVALGIIVLVLSLLVCLPYPFPFTSEAITSL